MQQPSSAQLIDKLAHQFVELHNQVFAFWFGLLFLFVFAQEEHANMS